MKVKITPYPFLLMGLVSLLLAIFAGLLRMGWNISFMNPAWALYHGPFMVSAFLGILISVERAAALQKEWMWAAPFLCGLGAICLVFNFNNHVAALLFSGGGIFMFLIFTWIYQKQKNLFHLLMLCGAACFGLANLFWFLGNPFSHIVFFWMAFLLLTICGERLELTRFRNPSLSSQYLLVGFNFLFVLGSFFQYLQAPLFPFLIAVSLWGISFWMLTQDMAMQSLKAQGLTRYIASSLVLGYLWLFITGVLICFFGKQESGWGYDAILHSFFLGFVFSMIFGHAPLILPAVLKIKMDYSKRFYFPLLFLHFSIILRIAGDLLHSFSLRKTGGLLNAIAILFFFINMKISSHRD